MKPFYRIITSLLIVLISGAISTEIHASNAQEIAQKAFDRPTGQSSYSVSKAYLSKDGNIFEERSMETYVQKSSNKEEKFLVKFNSPSLIRGTSLLILKGDDGTESTYLYLPALEKERRINGSQRHKRFADTEFTYEDLTRREVEKDTHSLISEDTIIGRPCFVIQSTPIDKDSSLYSKRKIWIDKEAYTILKIELFDHKGTLAKTYQALKQNLIQGLWTILDGEMQNHESNRKTRLTISEIKYDIPINRQKFNRTKMGDL